MAIYTPAVQALPEWQQCEHEMDAAERKFPQPATLEAQGYPWRYVPGYWAAVERIERDEIIPAQRRRDDSLRARGLELFETVTTTGVVVDVRPTSTGLR